MFCTNCGTKIEDGSQFCGNCGTSVAFNSIPQQQGNYIAPVANAQQANAQTNYVPPTQPNYAAPPNQPQTGEKNLASKGLNFSILSLVGAMFSYAPFMSILAIAAFFLAIASIVLSTIGLIKAKKAGQPERMAIVALIISALSIIICLVYDKNAAGF